MHYICASAPRYQVKTFCLIEWNLLNLTFITCQRKKRSNEYSMSIFKINLSDADKIMTAGASDRSRNITFRNAITAQSHVVKSCINGSKEMQTDISFLFSSSHYFIPFDSSQPHTSGVSRAKERRLSQDLATGKSQAFMASLSPS